MASAAAETREAGLQGFVALKTIAELRADEIRSSHLRGSLLRVDLPLPLRSSFFCVNTHTHTQSGECDRKEWCSNFFKRTSTLTVLGLVKLLKRSISRSSPFGWQNARLPIVAMRLLFPCACCLRLASPGHHANSSTRARRRRKKKSCPRLNQRVMH